MSHYFGKRSVSTITETRRYFSFPPLLIHGLLQPYNFGRAWETPGLRLRLPEPYEASNIKISFSNTKTLTNSEIYNEIDTTTLKCKVKSHANAFESLTAAMEEDTNQTSQQSRKWRILSYIKNVPRRAKHFG